jgi:hypothetical protein
VRPLLAIAIVAALLAPSSGSAELAIGSRSAGGGWVVTVALETRGLGQLDVSVGPLRPAAPSRSRSWLEHELAFANRGHRTLTFADTRTVRILDSLLVAEEGCGYSLRPLEPTCLLYLDIPSLRPGESRTRTVTLWKGLRGLKPLAAGTYVFKKTVRFQFGRAAPGPGHGHRGVIELTYKVEAGA